MGAAKIQQIRMRRPATTKEKSTGLKTRHYSGRAEARHYDSQDNSRDGGLRGRVAGC